MLEGQHTDALILILNPDRDEPPTALSDAHLDRIGKFVGTKPVEAAALSHPHNLRRLRARMPQRLVQLGQGTDRLNVAPHSMWVGAGGFQRFR
jgi:hypothetical protein